MEHFDRQRGIGSEGKRHRCRTGARRSDGSPNPECNPLVDEGRTERGGDVSRVHASIVAAMLLEIVSDLVCPWCYIGKRHLDAALTVLRSEDPTTSIDVHLRAFQLDPTAPLGSTQPVRDAYARRFGGEASADGIIGHVTRVAREAGITFSMDKAIRANTTPAHRLLKLVQTTEPHLQLAVNESVMQAYFSEGRNISEVPTLVECATRAGFVPQNLSDLISADHPSDPLSLAVAADLEWCQKRDVASVPTFVINDAFQVPGAQEPATLVRLLRRFSRGA